MRRPGVCVHLPCKLRALLRAGVPGPMYSKVTYHRGQNSIKRRDWGGNSFQFTGCFSKQINKVHDFHSVQKGLSVTWSFNSSMKAPLFLTITWHHLSCPWHTGSVWALIFQNYHLPQGLCIVYSCCLENTCSLLASCLVFFEVPVNVLPVGKSWQKIEQPLSTFFTYRICLSI